MNIIQTMPWLARISIGFVIAAIGAYPVSPSSWLPRAVGEFLSFAFPVIACLFATTAFFYYRRKLSREQMAYLRLSLACSVVLLLSIVVMIAITLPFVAVNYSRQN